ncbi:hypothetical protein ACP70R_030391 [Stipagrostis hirtigluma subsp. patula]
MPGRVFFIRAGYIYPASISRPSQDHETVEMEAAMRKKMGSSILFILSLEALLVVAGLSTAAAGTGDDVDTIRLPSDAAKGFGDQVTANARARTRDEERPWECCNRAICAKIWPPYCLCLDEVEQCSSACKNCEKVEDSDPPRYVCRDGYRGDPGPMCDEDKHSHVLHGVVAGAKKENDEVRPWRCCDRAVPGPSTSRAPVWYCMDKFDRCDCERCMEVEASHGYFCLDGYRGRDPGPRCTRDG